MKKNSFCFPYGGKISYCSDTLEIIKRVGYKNAISVSSRDININDLQSSIFELPRYDCNEIKKLYPEIPSSNPLQN